MTVVFEEFEFYTLSWWECNEAVIEFKIHERFPLNEDESLVSHGSIKFDGCINIFDEGIHFCGLNMVEDYFKVIKRLYSINKEFHNV